MHGETLEFRKECKRCDNLVTVPKNLFDELLIAYTHDEIGDG